MKLGLFKAALVPVAGVESRIYLLRGQKVMLDADLARLYGVNTKVLNQGVKRNVDRFPPDFMFQLTVREAQNLRSQIVTSNSHGGARYLSHAFTQEGIAMLSSVLRSSRAVQVNIEIMRAFVRMRGFLASQGELAKRLAELEKKHESHNEAIQEIFHAIKKLMFGPRERKSPRREIGFHTGMASQPESKPPRKRRATTGSKPASHPQ